MAYSYIWPASLPQVPQKGYSETSGVLLVRTQMDQGPAKQRRLGKKPATLSVSFLMSEPQVEILEEFVEGTLRGVARFGFPHPRLLTVKEVRILPADQGNLYTLQYVAPGYYNVALQLEILP